MQDIILVLRRHGPHCLLRGSWLFRGVEEPCQRMAKPGGCQGRCGAKHADSAHWAGNTGKRCPPELYMSLKPSSWLGWLVTSWLG